MSFRIPLPDDPFREYCFKKYGSIHNLIDKANNSEVVAQADLGLAYSEGFGDLLPRDDEKAIGWLTTAVNKGDESPVTLGKLGELLDRKGTSLYQRKAYEMYHRAAKQGCTNSQINLAEMYRCGVEGVVNEDIKEAFKWYKMAADEISNDSEPGEMRDLFNQTVNKLGDAVSGTKQRALKFLYKYYLEGDCPEGQPQPTKAVYYLTRAAELGDTEAQLNLGQIYLNGDCEQIKDASKAKRWLGKASANGDVLAKELLMKCDKMEDKGHSTSQLKTEALKELFNIRMEKLKQRLEANNHPFRTTQPTVLSEELLSDFEWSPTARIYLQAFRLLKQGLEILFKSNFADERGISFIARGYLTENSILQSFSHITLLLPEIFQLCEKSLQNNPSFFEGVVIAFAFPGYCGLKESNETKKIDFKKVMCIRNLINFIQKAERNGPPADNAFRFDQCYSSWLHVLYDHLAGHYIIDENYEEAAEAFENSLKCCPTYFPSKRGLGYCLLSLYQLRFYSEKEDSAPSELRKAFRNEKQIAENREVSKYRSWTTEELGKAAKKTLEEFLTEAPQCWKTYPNVCYYLAKLAFVNGDMKEVKKYYELGQDAEEKRLPFFSSVNLPDKEMLSPVYHAFTSSLEPAKCGNKACTKKVKETDLKACGGCRNKKYCSKDCQKADWKEHKAACTVSKRGKAKDGT